MGSNKDLLASSKDLPVSIKVSNRDLLASTKVSRDKDSDQLEESKLEASKVDLE